MATRTGPTQSSLLGASLPILCVCFVLSLLVHLMTAGGFARYAQVRSGADLDSTNDISIPDMPVPPQPEDDPLRLGREDAKSASITWLGVLENPVEGDAPESEVDQAELAINTGIEELAQPTPAQVTPPIEPVVEVTPEPAQPEPNDPEPAQEPETKPEQPQEPIEQPEQRTPVESTEPEVATSLEAVPAEITDPDPQPIPVTDPVEVEPVPEPPVQEVSEPQEEQEQTESQSEPQTIPSTPATTASQGKPGEEDDRDSIASMIKRATESTYDNLNRPLSGAGLEIKPSKPAFSRTTLFTQNPRNPIVLIRFNAEGKVIFADFIRDKEKKRVYDTGSRSVDEPLISAIYKWRASGKQLQDLDPDDPKSYIEISMKIIFNEEND